jgi:2-keto-3-deoxy-L-arabinonate dehydratase
MSRRFEGIYPVLYAFFDADGRLDRHAMSLQVEHCLSAGAHGIMVLGLVTEVHKQTTTERLHLVETVGALIAGCVPYAVTIGEPTADAQVDFARAAKAAGADWVILQPPPGKGHTEADLQRHFGGIADRLAMPAAIQNNPVNLDSSLSPDGLTALLRAHPNISLLKAEGWSVDIARVIENLGGQVQAFGGHGGLEFPSLMRSGGAGLIPAPDCVALQVAMFEAYKSGDPARIAQADAIHQRILPLIVFMTRSIPGLLCYGKRLMAKRLGLPEPFDRAPAIAPTAFGLTEMERVFADVLAAEQAFQSRAG